MTCQATLPDTAHAVWMPSELCDRCSLGSRPLGQSPSLACSLLTCTYLSEFQLVAWDPSNPFKIKKPQMSNMKVAKAQCGVFSQAKSSGLKVSATGLSAPSFFPL